MSTSTRVVLSVLLVAVLATPPASYGQATTGTISGAVTDDTKAVLPGATVHVTNAETGAARALVTDERGRFRALNLTPGLYAVSVELQGFQAAKRDRLTVEIGRDVAADFQLTIGSVVEQVTVQGSATDVGLSS